MNASSRRFLYLFVSLAFSAMPLKVLADPGVTRVWDGGAGTADTKWQNPLNWVADVAPLSGDSLEFPSAAPAGEPNNDYPAGTTFGAIRFTGGLGPDVDRTIRGNALQLLGTISNEVNTTRFKFSTVQMPVKFLTAATISNTGTKVLYFAERIESTTTTITFTGAGEAMQSVIRLASFSPALGPAQFRSCAGPGPVPRHGQPHFRSEH